MMLGFKMKHCLLGLLLVLTATWSGAQVFSSKTYGGGIFHQPQAPTQVAGPTHLEDYVADGRLRLGLEDAIMLTLLNNSDIQVSRAQLDISKFAVQRAHQPFDPLFVAGFAPTRSVSPSASTLVGASTLSTLEQDSNLGYSQQFQTGTTLGVSMLSTRSTTNSTFATVNPAFNSGLTFSLTQPLWHRGGFFANRAPIILAQKGVRQSAASFEAQINDTIARVINQYWDVVQARKALEVLQKSLELAEASYQHDKRALELGALPPLDIYRSESQVAQRKIAVIQAQYSLKQVEVILRQTIGADLDQHIESLDLDLIESAENPSPLAVVDLQETLAEAFKRRPEFEAQHEQLSIDDTNVKLANNNLKPDLNLTASYTTSGLGGVVFDNSTGVPVVVSPGGFTDSLSQLGGFNFPTYSMGLQLRVPVRNSAAAADLGSALVSKKRSLYQMRSLQQSIGSQVKNAVHDLELAEQVIDASRISRDLAGKNLQAEERKYQLGAQTIFFVLDAQSQLSQAELSLVQSQIAYQKALAEVDHATGALLEKHKVTISGQTP
jgi:outer membrane protein TolC